MRRLISVLWLAATGVGLVACCDESINSILLWPGHLGVGSPFSTPFFFFVGDSLTIVATADSKAGVPCFRELFTSVGNSGRFTFSSTDSTVAAVNAQGLLMARSLGSASVAATTADISSGPMSIVVEPRFESLRITAPFASPTVGDTLAVNIDAIDTAGNVVRGVYVAVSDESGIDSVMVFVRPSRPSAPLNALPTPVALLLQVVKPGVAVLRIRAPHASSQDKIDSVRVQVSGPSL